MIFFLLSTSNISIIFNFSCDLVSKLHLLHAGSHANIGRKNVNDDHREVNKNTSRCS